VTPDFLCLAKGLSGGYLPVSATLTTEDVFDAFRGSPGARRTFFHGHSYAGNPLACAVALASLDLFESDRVVEGSRQKSQYLKDLISQRIEPLRHVYEVRQRGLMVGIELRRDGREPYPPAAAIGARVCRLVRERGVILRPLGPVVVLMPPLSITGPELEHLVTATAAAIAEATAEGASAAAAAIPLPAPAFEAPPPLRPSAAPAPAPALRGLFIAGTDTAVGKTTVAAALLRLAHRRGLALVPSKPVESGVLDPAAGDAAFLRQAAGRSDIALDEIRPFAFPSPVAPAAGAAAARRPPLEIAELTAAVARVAARGRAVLVEAAGGLLSPYAPAVTGADLAAALGLPILIVARNGLGTINHTALTFAEIRRRALPIAGLVLVDTTAAPTPDRDTNAALIAAATGARPWGPLPFVDNRDPDALADALEACADVEALLAALA
jgi:dethiobiotin synthase